MIAGEVGYIIGKTYTSLSGFSSKDKKYENYGKVAAMLDDIANWIPARVTALVIMLLFKQKHIFDFYKDGKKHDSPNAGHPITAMALSLDISLGGDTYYFVKLKQKSPFGDGREEILKDDVKKALSIRDKIDKSVLVSLLTLWLVIFLG